MMAMGYVILEGNPFYKMPENVEELINGIIKDTIQERPTATIDDLTAAIHANEKKILDSMLSFIDGTTRTKYRHECEKAIKEEKDEQEREWLESSFEDTMQGMRIYLHYRMAPALRILSEPSWHATFKAISEKTAGEYGEKEPDAGEYGDGEAERGEYEMFRKANYSITFPEVFFSPKSKVANMMFENEFPSGEVTPVVTINQGKYGALVSYNYHDIEESPFIRIGDGSKLTEWERTVHDAVSTLMEAGNEEFTSEQILRVARQDPNANLTDTAAVEIAEAMMSLNRRETTIITDAGVRPDLWDAAGAGVLKPEHKRYQNIGKAYYGRLLDFRADGDIKVSVHCKDGSKKLTMTVVPTQWHMLARPLLYDYSKAKGQIASTPMKALYTATSKPKGKKLNRGRATDGIVNYLSRQIDTMKKDKNFSRFILWETLYELDGIDDVKEDDGNIRKKKSCTRRKVCKILDEFKESGLIEGYANVEKQRGRTKYLHSVNICLPEKTVTRSGKNGNASRKKR